MGAIQPWHLIILLAIVLIVVGPGKLPDVGKAVGQSLREFRKATGDIQNAVSLDGGTLPQSPAAAVAVTTGSASASPAVSIPGTAQMSTGMGEAASDGANQARV